MHELQQIAKRPQFEIPSLALKIGCALKKCLAIERGIAHRTENLKRNETLLSFFNLLELEWSIRISSNALATLHKRKINNAQLLPLTSDLVKLSKYLNTEMIKLKKDIENSCTPQIWSRLMSVILSRIIESVKITVQDTSRPLWAEQDT